jgi:hypothetical protein
MDDLTRLYLDSKRDHPSTWYVNFYKCPRCGTKWEDEWSSMCNDECPELSDIAPYESHDLD